jgi:hypothetical protein
MIVFRRAQRQRSRRHDRAEIRGTLACRGPIGFPWLDPLAAQARGEWRDDMTKRIDKSWVVLASLENVEGNRCIDLFVRPDGTYGFEEFRRDPEDAGAWTPVQYYSGTAYGSKDEALAAAARSVQWLAERLRDQPASG